MDFCQFYDSTPNQNNGTELRRRLRSDGYLFLRGVIPRDTIVRTEEAILREIAQAGWLKSGTDPRDRVADITRTCAEPDVAFRSVYNQVFQLEEFHHLPHTPTLHSLMQDLFGGDPIFVHPRPIARLIFPVWPGQLDFTTPAHQDYWAIQGTPETYSVWIPLHDCTFEHGSLMVAEGSHRNGVYGYRLSLGAGGAEVDDPLDGRWRGGNFEVGDMLIFSTLTVHKAAPNRTERLRLSIDCRFQRILDPINEACISLADQPFNWEDVYAKWQRQDLQYYWEPLDLWIVPYDPKYYQRRDDLALSEGEKGNVAAIAALQRLAKWHRDDGIRKRASMLVQQLSGAPV